MVYQGSKTKYAKYIIPILQQELNNKRPIAFIDACCGGCNIIDKISYHTRIAIDKNLYLIELYKYAVADGELPSSIEEYEWNERKINPDLEPKWRTGLISILCSYNSKGFVGGFIHTSNGRDYYNERLRNFQKQIPLLKNIYFLCKDINTLDVKNCLIYIDPPYQGTTLYDFSKGFDYEAFWDTVRRLSKSNYVYVSEQVAPAILKVFGLLKQKDE